MHPFAKLLFTHVAAAAFVLFYFLFSALTLLVG